MNYLMIGKASTQAASAAITSDKSTFDSIRLAVTVFSLTWVIVF